MSNASDYVGGAPALWVSGTTYAQGKLVFSPTDFQTYIRKVAGAGATDPSSDTTNWQPTGKSAVKSIQRGTISGNGVVNTTITSVNMAKTELRWLGFSVNGFTTALGAIISLTAPTNIQSNSPSGIATTINWELTEHY